MPHHFMLADLEGSLAGVCLFSLFLLFPGYAVAWLTNLFEFRRRGFAFQLALSVPLAIAVCPAATYFAARLGAAPTLYAVLWVVAVIGAVRRPMSLGPYARVAAALVAAWTVVAIGSLIDLQAGERAWYPSAAFDYSLRTGFIDSLGQTGVPPLNPYFYTAHAPLHYHYFWLLLCSLVNRAGAPVVSARHAWIAGAVWCGIGLMAVVALYFRLFAYRGPETFRRRAVTGILLLGVTGLDLIPTAFLWLLQATGLPAVRASMEWWNEQVDGFVYTALWESHYLSGLIACLMAFLILWRAPRHFVLAGIALASAAGASVYVAFVFGLFLLAWTAAALLKRCWREAAVCAGAGATGLALALPFALSLRGPSLGGPPLQLWIRPFSPLEILLRGEGMGDSWLLPLANLAALPFNYFLELGFFLVAAGVWWKRRRASGIPLDRAQTATLLLIATSLLTCTFLRSSVIGNNDLGWRGFLFAQFGLLLLAVEVLGDWGARRSLLVALLVLGAAGSAYELAINRFYAPLVDAGILSRFSWLGPDRHAGSRNYAYREAGEWLDAATPRRSVVQFDPQVVAQNTSALLYFRRPSLAGNQNCLATFGGDPARCREVVDRLDRIYRQPATDLSAVCDALPVDILAAGDTDAAWRDPHSWVWNQPPLFANRYVRLFRCPAGPFQ